MGEGIKLLIFPRAIIQYLQNMLFNAQFLHAGSPSSYTWLIKSKAVAEKNFYR